MANTKDDKSSSKKDSSKGSNDAKKDDSSKSSKGSSKGSNQMKSSSGKSK